MWRKGFLDHGSHSSLQDITNGIEWLLNRDPKCNLVGVVICPSSVRRLFRDIVTGRGSVICVTSEPFWSSSRKIRHTSVSRYAYRQCWYFQASVQSLQGLINRNTWPIGSLAGQGQCRNRFGQKQPGLLITNLKLGNLVPEGLLKSILVIVCVPKLSTPTQPGHRNQGIIWIVRT